MSTPEEICACCGKPGHTGRSCKAPFRKRWPGKPAIKMTIRTHGGATLYLESALTQEQYERAVLLLQEIVASQEDTE